MICVNGREGKEKRRGKWLSFSFRRASRQSSDKSMVMVVWSVWAKAGTFHSRRHAHRAPGSQPSPTPLYLLPLYLALLLFPQKWSVFLPRFGAQWSANNKADSRHHRHEHQKLELITGKELNRKQSIYDVDRTSANEKNLQMLE